MAIRRPDGSIQLLDGRGVYANSLLQAADLCEILPLCMPPPAWPFVNGGGGDAGAQGIQGPQGTNPGPQGNQGAQGNQGIQGPQGNQGRQGFQGLLSPDIYAATRVVSLIAGDGTDLTIAAAIAALPAEGGLILVKQGTYPIAATLTMPDKNVVIRGTGDGTVVSPGANAISAFTVPPGLTAERTYTFEDFKILGTAVANQRGWSIQDENSRGVVNVNRVNTEEVQFPVQVTDGGASGPPVLVNVSDCYFQQLADNSSILLANSPDEPVTNLSMIRVRFLRDFQDTVVGTFTQGGLMGLSNVNIIGSDSTFSIGSADCSTGAFNLTDCYVYNLGPFPNIIINIADDSFAAISSAVVGCDIVFVDFDINGSGTKFAECRFDSCSFTDNAGAHFLGSTFTGIGTFPSVAVIVCTSGRLIVVGCFFNGTAEGTVYVISNPAVVDGCVFLSGGAGPAAIGLDDTTSIVSNNYFGAGYPVEETGTLAENTIIGNRFQGGPAKLLIGGTTLLNNQTIKTTTLVGFTLSENNRTLLVDASGGAKAPNLPLAADSVNVVYTIKKIDASGNTVTVTPNGAETIDGAATVVLAAQWERVTVQCDGVAWFIID